MWRVTYEPDAHVLFVRLADHVSLTDIRDVAEAHARALEATGGQPFKVFVDLRGLFPLEAEAVVWLGAMKRVAMEHGACRGIAVLADSATVAMQQRRTRVRDTAGGGRVTPGTPARPLDDELITLDEAEAKKFLAT